MLTFAYGGGLRGHAYVIIVWKKMLNNLHKFFQGKRKSLESFYLLYGMFNRVLFGILLYSCMLNNEWIDILHDFFFRLGGGLENLT